VTKIVILLLFSMVLFPFVSLSGNDETAIESKPGATYLQMLENYRELGLIEDRP